MNGKIIIDAKNATLGRLASYAAKQALLGKEIAIVNCEEAVIVGRPRSVIAEYRVMRQRGGSSLNGPFFPKYPDRLVKRTIRGMLAHRQGRGLAAFKRVKCYNGVPKELAAMEMIKAGTEKTVKTIKLKELSKEL